MAEVTTRNGRAEIELTIQNEFIFKYGHQKLVQHPFISFFIDYSKPGSFKFPYSFQPHNKFYDKPFTEIFLNHIKGLLNDFKLNPETHLDPLLFLVNSYPLYSSRSRVQNFISNREKVDGKLLVGLLRMPFAEITKDNIVEHLPKGEEEDYLSLYLGVVSGKPERTFQRDGKVDLALVDDTTWTKLVDRITADNNIKIPLEGNKELLFSKDIKLKLHCKGASKTLNISPVLDLQNRTLTEILLKHLIQEEKQNNTELYRIISGKHFDRNRQANDLTRATIDDENFSHYAILKRIAQNICDYLHEEGLMLKPKRNGAISTAQKNFLYPFFLLQGLIPRKDRSIRAFETLTELDKEIETYRAEIHLDPRFSEKKLNEAFKSR